jgi:electron transport complex protein RnfG
MSQLPLAGEPPRPNVWHMYRSMVGIGILCGLLIVVVYEVTRPVIERNKAEALQRAIFQVLPAAAASATYMLADDEHFQPVEGPPPDGAALVYAGYDEQGELIGVAVEAQGMGYQDVIRVIYGYSFAEDAVIGIQVLETKETPGLGTKIETDPDFLKNFERLDVSLDEGMKGLAHPIEAVKKGEKEHPWQIDAITGATISSNAIASLLGRSTEYWIPRIRRNLDDMRETE